MVIVPGPGQHKVRHLKVGVPLQAGTQVTQLPGDDVYEDHEVVGVEEGDTLLPREHV